MARHRRTISRPRHPSGPRRSSARGAFRRPGRSPSCPGRPLSALLRVAGYASLLAACAVLWGALFAAAALGAPVGFAGFALSVGLVAAGLFALGEAS